MAQKPPQSSPGVTEAALQQAAYAIQRGRPQDAERIALDILARNAGDLRAMHALGHSLLLQKRPEEAIAPLERAAQQARDPAIDTWLAMALRGVGRTDDALSRFKRAVKREPPFPPAFLEYGALLTQLHRYGEAREIYSRALALAPNYPDLLFAAAKLFQTVGDFGEAASLYQHMLTVAPADSAARIGLGICQIELGDREKAFDNFRMVTKENRAMFWQVISALTHAGHGALWLRISDAEAALL